MLPTPITSDAKAFAAVLMRGIRDAVAQSLQCLVPRLAVQVAVACVEDAGRVVAAL